MTRIVLVTGALGQHRYVANVLSSEHELAAVIVDAGEPLAPATRLKRSVRRHGYLGVVQRAMLVCWRRLIGQSRERARAFRRIFGDNAERFNRADLVRTVHGINGEESVCLLRQLQPDVLLVFGTSVLSKRVLASARLLALNLHTGMSPHYRGTDCAFWPLYNGELQLLGATVHECTGTLDAGPIYATTGIVLEEHDGIEEVFARCVSAGAHLYSRVLAERPWENPSHSIPQDLSLGCEYRSHMRGLAAELRLRSRIHNGLIRNYVLSSTLGPAASQRS